MGNNKDESKETKQVCCGRGEQQLSHSPLEQDGACPNCYGKGFVTCLTNASCLNQDVALTAYSDVVRAWSGFSSRPGSTCAQEVRFRELSLGSQTLKSPTRKPTPSGEDGHKPAAARTRRRSSCRVPSGWKCTLMVVQLQSSCPILIKWSRPGKISSCSNVVPGPRTSLRIIITEPPEFTSPGVMNMVNNSQTARSRAISTFKRRSIPPWVS